MTLHPLPVPAALPPALAGLRTAVTELQAVPLSHATSGDLAEATAALSQVEAQVAALRLEVLAEADARKIAEETADTGTDAWAAKLTGDTRQVMRGGLLLAQDLRERFHATREAFSAGRLTLRQVKVIVHATRQSPPEATPEQVAAAEQYLVDKATGAHSRSGRPMNPTRLRQAARRMFAPIDPALADRHEAILLGREHRNAEASTFFQINDNGDGTWSGKFTIPELHGHLFKQAIERLTAPRRLSRNRKGESVIDLTAETSNIDELRGAALCELLEHLPTDGHTANGVTLIVTTTLQWLRDQLGSARLDTGTCITSSEALRLACNAGIAPVVLSGKGVPLHLGRTHRLHSKGQRTALAAIFDTCAAEGCERPFSWCEIHHPVAWLNGGPTDIENAIPLCGHHHRRAHDSRWDLRQHTNGEWRFHRRR